MNTSPCKFYRAGSIASRALDFVDAELGQLVYTYPADNNENLALVIDERGMFVTTFVSFVKVTDVGREERIERIVHDILKMSKVYVPTLLTDQFERDVINIKRKP
jgi:hypothetical protein